MSNPWPAFETYTWTGNKEIAAALTTLFAKDDGSRNTNQWSWNRYRRMPKQEPGAEPNDHVVHFLESTVPWTIGYLWTGNREFLDATIGWHDLLERDAMQPSGVPVADEFYGPTGAFRGTETCDVAGYLWSQIVLLTVSGQGRMADRAERAFFNAGPATVSRDFKTHVYFQCPNRLVDNSPPHPHGPQAEGNSYQATHYPLCCTAALNRIVPNYVMHMWMATYDNGLAATHYGPCKVSALVADRVPVELACRTDYPFNDVDRHKRESGAGGDFSALVPHPRLVPESRAERERVRRPSLARRQGVRACRAALETGRRHTPAVSDVGERAHGRDNNAQGAPYASVSYGPLLFALPIPDTQGPNTPDPAAKWQLCARCARREGGGRDCRGTSGDAGQMGLAAGISAEAAGRRRGDRLEPGAEAPRLPPEPIAKREPPERITLIPYGCTKFRVSMFPVTERAWKAAETQGAKGRENSPSWHPVNDAKGLVTRLCLVTR